MNYFSKIIHSFMKQNSCGAILYLIDGIDIYIILGMERGDWFPFKGIKEDDETFIQAAIREIKEETCDAVHINFIDLKCKYSTKRKHYYIGLIRITISEFNQFFINRTKLLNAKLIIKNKHAYLEKDDIKMFPLDNIMSNSFHSITNIPIKYYHKYLHKLQYNIRRYYNLSKGNNQLYLEKISCLKNLTCKSTTNTNTNDTIQVQLTNLQIT